jgi:transcription initiation factor TFIIIB Brf1 subunit/transcription initiation factor TFIIB
MHKNQKLRLLQEITVMLQLTQPASSTVLQFYSKFTEAIPSGKYSNEIVVCACVYLVSKIFEDERRIRDILNAINSAIKLYTLASAKRQGNYIKLGVVLEGATAEEVLASIQPIYELIST